ncbi:D-glycerate dehydrogenase [Pedobacter sp. L105]|uniref:2-hydroxyacid dehydrogenase n=1 Tax=Pedobacter sp. L105 TaxID=1641871 RepID=UPI00131CD302|nr:D-glycerate dehydrogenase [Pedobacter sp. L105]
MNVFVTRIIPEAGLQLLEAAGFKVKQWTEKRKLTNEELIEECRWADALLNSGQQLNREFLEASAHLKIIALNSVGYDNVDIETATRLKIPIGNTPGVLSEATADTAFLLMLASSRNAFFLNRTITEGKWNFHEPTANLGRALTGNTLGVFGLGKIGMEMARRSAAAFKMKIIYHNRSKNIEAEEELGAKLVSFDELLQQSDVISVHTALTPDTEGKFNLEAFKKMKPGAIFVNTARGAIHNETDLIKALQEKIIWGAGLDVTNPEPMHADNVLLRLPNVAVLPHIGSATVETRDAMVKLAAENIIAGLNGKKIPHLVNPEIYQ